jgi:hypothetical protein
MAEPMLPRLAFKEGTCLKKIYFGNTGRFSMDLDFTSIDIRPEELRKDLLDEKSWYGIDFKINDENLTPDSKRWSDTPTLGIREPYSSYKSASENNQSFPQRNFLSKVRCTSSITSSKDYLCNVCKG